MENMGLEIFDNIFYNKRILITGHTGFKGSWLSIWLNELGSKVLGYALDPYTENDNFQKAHLSEKIIDVRGDIRDYGKVTAVFKEYQPELVFHLAAQPLVREGYLYPKDTYDVNVTGTVNVLECCRRFSFVKGILIITSDKCYENKEWVWGYRENDPMGGHDPYSSSKGCAELITSAYQKSFFNKEGSAVLASARAGNVIGGGDWAKDRLVPDCIRSLESQESIRVRQPLSTRPWQFVLEPLGGYLTLMAQMLENPHRFSGGWNFGPYLNSIKPVKEIVNLVIDAWGEGTWQDLSDPNAPHEANALALDISKAGTYLNWTPVLDIEEAIHWTVEWYKIYKKENDMYPFCRQQIQDYMERKK